MILQIKSWCEGIIVAIILCIIIESLTPEGNNKKYIKVVIGIYIVYVCLNPLLNLLNYDYDSYFNLFKRYAKTEEVSNFSDSNIKEVYVSGIEQNIKNEIEEMGYSIDKVKVFVDLNYENIEKVELKINANKIDAQNEIVKPVVISNEKCEESYEDILNYICENYLVNRKEVIIK